MDYEMFQYCKERGYPEYYARQYENQIRMTFDFQAWRLAKAFDAFIETYKQECFIKPFNYIKDKLKR